MDETVPNLPDFTDVDTLRAGFEQGQERPEHYEAIGRVIASFADIEIATHWTFADLVGIPRYLINPVLGGSRWGDVSTQMKAVLKKKPHPNAAMILDSLERCAKVKLIRDIVAHWTWSYKEDLLLFTNHWFTKDNDASQYRLYSIKFLEAVSKYEASLPMWEALRPSSFDHNDDFFTPEIKLHFETRLRERLNAPFPDPGYPEINNPHAARKPKSGPKNKRKGN